MDGLEHMLVEIDDLEEEDLLSYLPRCMDFVYDNCQDGRNVLVHWYASGSTFGRAKPLCLSVCGGYLSPETPLCD